MVKPAEATPGGSIWQCQTCTPQQFTSTHPPVLDPIISSTPKFSSSTLSKTLVTCYPIASLYRCDDSDAEGVLFVEAETNSRIDDFGNNFTPTQNLQKLIPTVDYAAGIHSYPFLVAQVAQTVLQANCLQ